MRLQSINRDIRSRTSLAPAEAATPSSAKLNWPTLRSDIVPSCDSNSQKWNHTCQPYAKPSLLRAMTILGLTLVHDAVAQRADVRDFHLQHIAGLHPDRRSAPRADAVGRAGGDDVAGRQRREGRA